jgi:integrase
MFFPRAFPRIYNIINMASVNFYLKEPKATKETPINMFFAYGGKKPLKYPVKDKILPSQWNDKKQRIRESRTIRDCEERNAFLTKVESAVNNIYTTLLLQGVEITEDILRDRLDIALNRVIKPKLHQLLVYSAWLAKQKKEMGTTDRHIVKMAADNLAEYCKENKTTVDFGDMNLNFREKFIYFLNKKEYRQNSVKTVFAALKIILTQAQEEGYNPHNGWRSKKFSAKSEKVKKTGLSPEEIDKLLYLDLSKQPKRYEDIRDMFLIGFATTLRVSDFVKLKEENFENGKVVRKTQKTGRHVTIPMHRVLRVILERRGGKLPIAYDKRTINEDIKEIAKLAEINTPMVVSYTKGGKRVDEVKEKWETITTHTARRSSVRQMRKAGIDKDKAKLLSGHESDSAFNIYDEIDTEENAIELANHPYFQ